MNDELQNTTPLLDKLKSMSERSHSAFYAPGHKRGRGISQSLENLCGKLVFQADLPELPELDNLFAPEGVIQQAQQLAAQIFGADSTWFLTNGSTCGIVAAILATCRAGEKIILPRNIHTSAIAGLILSGAIPIFIDPEYDRELNLTYSITPEAVETALKQHSDVKVIMMLYPTYQGVCGDIEAIAKLSHQYDLPLLVDEAHGAHFTFHEDLPISALAAGADLAVQSTHKVLGAMTQASMLHVKGNRINPEAIANALQLVQSTSPSYILLASLDAARQQMAIQGQELMSKTLELADKARSKISNIEGLSVLDFPKYPIPGFKSLDRTRLTVDVSQLGLSGYEADEILHEQLGITAELPLLKHLTFIISLGNTSEDIDRLVEGFSNLAIGEKVREGRGQEGKRAEGVEGAEGAEGASYLQSFPSFPCLDCSPCFKNRLPTSSSAVLRSEETSLLCTCSRLPTPVASAPPETEGKPPHPTPPNPREAFFAAKEIVPIDRAIGRISAELICPYPPGIPVLMPGEAIAPEVIEYLQQVIRLGARITGCSDTTLKTLKVVK
jgi:arginine decarboxylase